MSKPSNVLFRAVRNHERSAAAREGRLIGEQAVMLGDFGLAKDVAAAPGFTLAAGTPGYMAPEQARASDNIDRRADVFADVRRPVRDAGWRSRRSRRARRRERAADGDSEIPARASGARGSIRSSSRSSRPGWRPTPDRRIGLGDEAGRSAARRARPADGAAPHRNPAPSSARARPMLAPPPSTNRPSLQPVGAAGRVKDLMMTRPQREPRPKASPCWRPPTSTSRGR